MSVDPLSDVFVYIDKKIWVFLDSSLQLLLRCLTNPLKSHFFLSTGPFDHIRISCEVILDICQGSSWYIQWCVPRCLVWLKHGVYDIPTEIYPKYPSLQCLCFSPLCFQDHQDLDFQIIYLVPIYDSTKKSLLNFTIPKIPICT